ncbi:MAG: hypothetical protein IPJ81_15360 [Chitinophagaceae bacterium]|nr:hypothetical protein [Chitinophagaceae bacterium]
MFSRNNSIALLIVGLIVTGFCVANIIGPEYFLMTSKEGTGVVKEVKRETKKVRKRRGGTRIVNIQIPVISFTNPKDEKEYLFEAQEYSNYFSGRPGDSLYIHYKIEDGIATGVIAYAPGESTFYSRNKTYFICSIIGLGLTMIGFTGIRKRWG